jgi:hypothetical protein
LKAIVEAHAVGAGTAELKSVLDAARSTSALATRAVAVLTDLLQRGYPAKAAAHAVGSVAAHSPSWLSQLPAQAESLRLHQGVGAVEALDALARVGAAGLGLEQAVEALRKNGPPEDGRGPDRETSGPRGPGNNGRGRGRP